MLLIKIIFIVPQIQDHYSNYDLYKVCRTIVDFVTNDISATYCHLIKDRLYCDDFNNQARLGALDVTGQVLSVLVRSIAPILPHLAEEVWLHHPENLGKDFKRNLIKHKTCELWFFNTAINSFSFSAILPHTEQSA